MKTPYQFILIFILCLTKSFGQSDCSGAIVVCGNSGFNGLTVTGIGVQELGNGANCGSQENNSIWLRLNINTSGTLSFTLIPQSNDINEDFDFFIFQSADCNNLGSTIRCSTTNPAAINQPNNHTGLNSSEQDTSEGPGGNGNSFLKLLDVLAGQSYFLVVDRPIGNSNFNIEWGGTATFNEPPIFDLPTGVTTLDIMKCDIDGVPDSSTDFDLTQNTPLITGTQNDVTVSYYTNQNDVIVGMNAIANTTAFINTQSPQAIFARIENNTTHCFATTEFQIGINNNISFPALESAVCDDNADGNDANGKAVFDMNNVTADIFGSQDVSSFTIKYYHDQNDANLNQNELPQLFYNTQPNLQTVIIKASSSSCSGTQPIDLIVKPLPSKVTANLVQCDFEADPDGITLFNLNEADVFFTNNDPDFSIAYFENTTQLQNDIVLSNNYTNLTNPQTIIARLTDNRTGCSSICSLILNVNIIPGQTLSQLTLCDILDQEDGFNTFDLSSVNVVLTPSQTVSYYAVLEDALLEQNSITNITNYPNQVPYNDVVFVRIDDTNNNCSGISRINLVVNKLPNIVVQSDGNDFVCTNLPNRYITIDAAVLDESTLGYEYLWHYNGNVFPMPTYSVQVNKPGTYTVTVIRPDGCRKTRTIEVSPSVDATIESVDIQDITVENNTVTVNLTDESIGNYSFSLDEPTGPFQESNFFENVHSGIHTVYVNDGNGCGIISQFVAVLGIPAFFTPNGDGFNDFWRIDGVDAVFNKETNVYIFDRFGKLVKEIATRDTGGWDGTLNGNPLPSDDYWYVANLEDGRIIKGHFALKR